MAAKSVIEKNVETEKADVFDTPATNPESKLSFREFVESLDGVDKLTASGMRVDYKARKLTLTEWRNEFDVFANSPVK